MSDTNSQTHTNDELNEYISNLGNALSASTEEQVKNLEVQLKALPQHIGQLEAEFGNSVLSVLYTGVIDEEMDNSLALNTLFNHESTKDISNQQFAELFSYALTALNNNKDSDLKITEASSKKIKTFIEKSPSYDFNGFNGFAGDILRELVKYGFEITKLLNNESFVKAVADQKESIQAAMHNARTTALFEAFKKLNKEGNEEEIEKRVADFLEAVKNAEDSTQALFDNKFNVTISKVSDTEENIKTIEELAAKTTIEETAAQQEEDKRNAEKAQKEKDAKENLERELDELNKQTSSNKNSNGASDNESGDKPGAENTTPSATPSLTPTKTENATPNADTPLAADTGASANEGSAAGADKDSVANSGTDGAGTPNTPETDFTNSPSAIPSPSASDTSTSTQTATKSTTPRITSDEAKEITSNLNDNLNASVSRKLEINSQQIKNGKLNGFEKFDTREIKSAINPGNKKSFVITKEETTDSIKTANQFISTIAAQSISENIEDTNKDINYSAQNSNKEHFCISFKPYFERTKKIELDNKKYDLPETTFSISNGKCITETNPTKVDLARNVVESVYMYATTFNNFEVPGSGFFSKPTQHEVDLVGIDSNVLGDSLEYVGA